MPIELTMPRLSDTMEQGTIVKWNIKVGDTVSAGDAVADIETDKAIMEMQVYDDGIVSKILIEEGETVDVGTLIALVAEEDEDPEEVAASAASSNGTAAVADASNETEVVGHAPAATDTAEPGSPSTGRIRISPVARRLADDHGIDLHTVAGSGPSGRIIKRDVMRVVETSVETAAAVPPSARTTVPVTPVTDPAATPRTDLAPTAPSAIAGPGLESRRLPLTNMRQTIARRLVESKTTIPHYQVTVSFNMDTLLGLRKTLNEQLASQGVKLSVNDFLVRGCALSMHQHPEFNASWGGDHIQVHGDVNVGLAIAIPAERGGGLVVGAIHHADQKSLRTISQEAKSLAEKARNRGLSVEELSGATFTLSNLGMFGVDHFTAIINPPNSAILAVGAAQKKPVIRGGEVTVGHEMSVTGSFDHRVIDGAMGARYLQTLKEFIENPATLLV